MSDSIIISNLRKVFKTDDKETVALENFSLEIKKGELISIVGPSGCGKTTLLRMIAGLLDPTSGEVLIAGKKCEGPGPNRGMVFQEFALFPWRSVRKNVEFGLEMAGFCKEERRKEAERYIQFIGLEGFEDHRVHELSGGMKQRVGLACALVTKFFQDFSLSPWDSVKKNVEFGLEMAGFCKAERRKKAERYIQAVGLEGFEDHRVHELSGGMKQRVGLARALVTKPDVMLMDEPFGSLDAQTRNIMQGELLKIAERTDTTIIFVTHSVDEAVYLSDRVVVLTKRPASIKEIVNIDLPRPRDRASPDFIKLRRHILTELESENVKITSHSELLGEKK